MPAVPTEPLACADWRTTRRAPGQLRAAVSAESVARLEGRAAPAAVLHQHAPIATAAWAAGRGEHCGDAAHRSGSCKVPSRE